jgi:hypothetical protein
MKAFRAKTRNKTPCHGVVGGVVEIPPDTPVKQNAAVRYTLTRRVIKYNTTNTGMITSTNTCYDNANLSTTSLVRAFIVFITVMLWLIISN